MSKKRRDKDFTESNKKIGKDYLIYAYQESLNEETQSK